VTDDLDEYIKDRDKLEPGFANKVTLLLRHKGQEVSKDLNLTIDQINLIDVDAIAERNYDDPVQEMAAILAEGVKVAVDESLIRELLDKITGDVSD
jgi:hypothetical protein